MTPRHARPASIPTICNNRANPATKGKPIGMPKPIQIPVNIFRITPLRRIDDRGNCGKSAACMHFTPSLLNFSTSYSDHPAKRARAISALSTQIRGSLMTLTPVVSML